MSLPTIAITIGDPAGIGPEITAKALSNPSISKICRPVVIGSKVFFPAGIPKILAKKNFIDIGVDSSKVIAGRNSATSGRAAYEYILRAVDLVRSGYADALVTAPVSKAAFMLAGVPYPGHTELLASLTGTSKFVMMMIAGRLRAAMVTRHMPLSETGKNLSVENISETVLLSAEFVRLKYRIAEPRVAVSSLNPHAGEGGMLGKEENGVIVPAVRLLKTKGCNVEGPMPADSLWVKLIKKEFDLAVMMYHDQVMIGLKCVAPEKVVNITAGLPFVRTSPGHGTGFDIAGKNCADPGQMVEAIKTAVQLVKC
ncbi:MAG: 4-hydroxythreonine-4-phosphate dehydrogenase PdxA [Elusimicrobiota bacterium]